MIQAGSKVVHEKDPNINDSLMMDVIEIEDGKALCSLNDCSEQWFSIDDLREIYSPEPVFH
ncbi:hypothetical protein AAOE16_03060 [Ekhidna sp. MALMAid0563]|uniref:hypothetical protein n=1 Tax=Ekhidna sp. MALMAid0563 TaxID=3143937 RepID=UPI0032DF42E4